MKCEKCQGKGFIEFEHGLLMMGCDMCLGTKEVADYIPPEAVDSIELPKELEEVLNDDSNSGTGQSNTVDGSTDTSKPKQPKKQKPKKKAGKGAS